MFILLGIVACLVILALFVLATYKVIEPNEAHVITFMGSGRRVYSPRDVLDDKDVIISKKKTAYFYIPFLMKRIILPLTNVKMAIDNIHLNDAEVAPFICDVITWITIENPISAAEKLSSQGDGFSMLKEDLINIVQSVARTVSMKQEILDIMRDRESFSKAVFAEVDPLLKKWGVDLVNLEVNDIRDDESKNSNVIHDYESIRKIEVNALARKETATKDKEATLVEQQNKELSQVATAKADREIELAQIAKVKATAIAEQEKETEIARATDIANKQVVLAKRTLDVGNAQVEKEAEIESATGLAEAIRIKGEKEAAVVKLKGEADGSAISAKGSAEAEAKEKMAIAMAKFNDAATIIEKIKAYTEIAKAKWEAYGRVAENANIKIVNSGNGADIFGIPLNAETGADLGQMLDGLDLKNIDLSKLDLSKLTKHKKSAETQNAEDAKVC